MNTTETETEQRRLTPSQRLHEVTLAALQRQPAPSEHTVDIARNAKGQIQWSVAVRGSDIDACVQTAIAKADELDKRFPCDANGGGS